MSGKDIPLLTALRQGTTGSQTREKETAEDKERCFYNPFTTVQRHQNNTLCLLLPCKAIMTETGVGL